MPDVFILNVALHGEMVGTLTRVSGDRSLFAFNEAYIQDENRPTLGLSFKDQLGDLRTDFRPVQRKVMPFFSNLLPEGPMRRYLSEQAGVNAEREFFLLWALGQDLPGAVTITPVQGEAWPPEAVTEEEGRAVPEAAMLRFSLAGVQLKFSAVEGVHGGLTIPASGVGGDWIVKLPSREYEGVPENEYSMMRLAQLMGFTVPAVDLIEIDKIAGLPVGTERFGTFAFKIQRFDRLTDGTRVHMEDFAQVFDVYSDEKYKRATMRNIASVLAAETPDEDQREFIARLTFNTLIGNGDMHLKNWSLLYPDRRTARLAPAYDFVSTLAYIPGDSSALKFSRKRQFAELDSDELSHLAAKAGLPVKMVLDTARDTTARFLELWAQEKAHLPLYENVRKTIDTLLPTLPLVTGR